MEPTSTDDAIAAIGEDFALLGDWEERYAYVIEQGRTLAPLSAEEHDEAHKVRGCASQVWLVCEKHPDQPQKLLFRGDSDAALVRGLIALLLRVYSPRTAAEILAVNAQAMFESWGLAEALTPQRSNGFRAMVERIRAYASAA